MNTANNKRRKDSVRRIGTAFIKLLQTKELGEISVTDICKLAEINRTTFYSNFIDIYDLAEQVQNSLEQEVVELYREEWEQGHGSHDFLRLFCHIKENPLFYKTYFKLNTDGKLRFMMYNVEDAVKRFDNKNIDYHIAFFSSGLNAIIKKWLENDCRESPEEIFGIIKDEYKGIS